MNQNIFQRINNDKYNPDIIDKYNNMTNNRTTNFNQSKEVWKGITGENFDANDLKIKIEKPEVSEILNRLNIIMTEREDEERIRKEIAKTYKNENEKNNIEKEYSSQDHHQLKKYHIDKNDKLIKEKEKFNAILEELNDIMR